jgi:RNA recognition motif-containing protein
MEKIIFVYQESFLKFYRNLDLNGNRNSYRKYGNKIDRKTRNRKRKWFESIPNVFENYIFIRYFTVGNKFSIFSEKY